LLKFAAVLQCWPCAYLSYMFVVQASVTTRYTACWRLADTRPPISNCQISPINWRSSQHHSISLDKFSHSRLTCSDFLLFLLLVYC